MMYKKRCFNLGQGILGDHLSVSYFPVRDMKLFLLILIKNWQRNSIKKRVYKLVIKKNELPDEIILIENIRAIDSFDKEAVIREIVDTDIIATAVGKHALPQIVLVIALGLQLRYKKRGKNPLDIIIAENLRNAADYSRKELKIYLPQEYPFDEQVGLIESSIGKMVPLMKEEDKKGILCAYMPSFIILLLWIKKGLRTPFLRLGIFGLLKISKPM